MNGSDRVADVVGGSQFLIAVTLLLILVSGYLGFLVAKVSLGRNRSISMRIFQFQVTVGALVSWLAFSLWFSHAEVNNTVVKELGDKGQFWLLVLFVLSSFPGSVAVSALLSFWIQHFAKWRDRDSGEERIARFAKRPKKVRKGILLMAEAIPDIMDDVSDIRSYIRAKSLTKDRKAFFEAARALGTLAEDAGRAATSEVEVHLCLSSDHRLSHDPFSGEAALTLLFAERQLMWAKQYGEDGEIGRRFGTDVIYFRHTRNASLGKDLEKAILNTAKDCSTRLHQNYRLLTNQPLTNERKFYAPRGLRLTFSRPDELVRAAVAYAGNGALFPGLQNGTPVWNLWVCWDVVHEMDVKDWASSPISPPGGQQPRKWEKTFLRFPGSRSVFELEKEFALAAGVEGAKVDKLAGQYQRFTKGLRGIPRKPANLEYLCVGHCRSILGYGEDLSSYDNPNKCRAAWLEMLPVLLMAMHCRCVLSFDDIVNWIGEQMKNQETVESEVTRISHRLKAFIDQACAKVGAHS